MNLPKVKIPLLVITFVMGILIVQGAPREVQAKEKYSNNPVIGIVNGKDVRLADIRSQQIYELETKLYQNVELGLVQHALEELSKTHKEITMTPEANVTEAQVEKFYNENDLKKKGTLQQLGPQIRQYMEQKGKAEFMYTQYTLAVKKGWVTSHLEAPGEFLVKTVADTSFIRGNSKATVMVLEFSDYQCPYCGRIQETITDLVNKYKDKVAFGYRHFPLPFHKEADEAAIAAECAGEQGKFDEMHQLLYVKQREQNIKDLKDYARQIKVPQLKKFDQCLDQEKYRFKVERDIEEGRSLGINGTPGFVIGTFDYKTKIIEGEVLSGAQPKERFEEVIQKYLNRKS